jgi:16S rRNA (guanine527-N7)-methyltransferase
VNRRDESSIFGIQNQEDSPKIIEPAWDIPKWFKDLGDEKLSKLKAYQQELFRFNERLNLISPNTKQYADRTHFADSILAGKMILSATDSATIHDIGSGNGFPGLVMAILDPERNFMLIDKDERKIEFLKIMIGRLALKNCEAKKAKLEELPAGSIECAVSRAFAPLGRALLAARKAFKSKGQYFHIKGESWATEVMDIPAQACTYWSNDLLGEYKIPDTRKSNFVVVTRRE